MRRTTVADVMTRGVVSVAADTSFSDVAHLLFTAAVRAVPVLDADRRLLGVVSEADVLTTTERADPDAYPGRWPRRSRHFSRSGPNPHAGATTARQLMTTPVRTVTPDTTVAGAARRMREKGLSWLPVVDADNRVIGVLGRSDLLAVFLRDDASIRTEILEEVLGRMMLIDPGRVAVTVDQGVVTLSGELETHAEAVLVVRLVGRVEGVVDVVDRLRHRVDERIADSRAAPLY